MLLPSTLPAHDTRRQRSAAAVRVTGRLVAHKVGKRLSCGRGERQMAGGTLRAIYRPRSTTRSLFKRRSTALRTASGVLRAPMAWT